MESMRPFVCATRCVVCVTVDASKKSVDVCLRQTDTTQRLKMCGSIKHVPACLGVLTSIVSCQLW
eukprot:172448-Prymnesium_polylepis.1